MNLSTFRIIKFFLISRVIIILIQDVAPFLSKFPIRKCLYYTSPFDFFLRYWISQTINTARFKIIFQHENNPDPKIGTAKQYR